jgi:cytochrome c peroxidase
MDRTVGVFDLGPVINTGVLNVPQLATLSPITSEKLTPDVLAGKQLFYDARDTRLARDRYLSCASCHNDGGSDGRVWDITGFGEGLRNTITLRGRAGAQGFLHWSNNFDEVQDFEGQIRALAGGTGLMADADFFAGTRSQPLGDPKTGLSADLDALAAYVKSLDKFVNSPLRNQDGSLTSDAVAGKTVFTNASCGTCQQRHGIHRQRRRGAPRRGDHQAVERHAPVRPAHRHRTPRLCAMCGSPRPTSTTARRPRSSTPSLRTTASVS